MLALNFRALLLPSAWAEETLAALRASEPGPGPFTQFIIDRLFHFKRNLFLMFNTFTFKEIIHREGFTIASSRIVFC